MEETKFTTDADVILKIYGDYKNLSERYKALEEEKNSYRNIVLMITDLIDRNEIEKAKKGYYCRGEIERDYISAKDLKKAIGLPEGICEEAERILREREEGVYEESKSDGE